MRRWILLLTLGLSPWASLGACSSASQDASDFPGTGSGTTTGLADADQSFDASLLISTQFRVVHLLDSASAIDFCYRSIGTSDFSGPVLADLASSGDAGPIDATAQGDSATSVQDASWDGATSSGVPHSLGASALPRLSVSPMIQLLTPGTLEIAIVDGDHPTCASPLASATLTLDVGKTAWIAVVGTQGDAGGASIRVQRYVVDTRADALHARVRIVHAATAHPETLDVSASSEQITPLVRGVVRYATTLTGQNPSLDALGYATLDPVSPPAMFLVSPSEAPLEADGGTTWTSAFTDPGLSAGSVHTAFLASEGNAYAVLSCSELGSGECRVVKAP